MPVDLYTRLSRVEKEQTATVRQEADCRTFCTLREWEIGTVLSDVDFSAYQRDVVRPDYERLLERIRTGETDGVVVWKLDRLVRRSAEFERFWSICETAGAFVASATEPIDTRSEIGMMVVRILVAFAQLESATMSLRIRRAKEQRAKDGIAQGRRPYGLSMDRTRIVEAEAMVIREAADRLIAGATLRSIVLDLNRRGIPTATGGRWKQATIRGMLLRSTTVGDLTWHGDVVSPDAFPAILDRETQDRVALILFDPARRQTARSGSLLGGLVRCGGCGAPMMHGTGTDHKGRYYCPSAPQGCNSNSMHSAVLDGWVTEAVLDYLRHWQPEQPDTRAERKATARLDEVARALAELGEDYYVKRAISRATFERAHATLEDEQRALQRHRPRKLRVVVGDPEGAWLSATLDLRRQVIADAVARVTVMPVGKGRRRTFPDDIPIVWR